MARAKHYPSPKHQTIVEPFAGAAGYSLTHHSRDVLLIEKYGVIAEMWRFLIGASAFDIMQIPIVDSVDDLPSRVPQGARYLVGFSMGDASVSPRKRNSAGAKRDRATGRMLSGWFHERREMIARQVGLIKHWKVVEGDYFFAPDIDATWFVDPPYNNNAGALYVHSDLDYVALGDWCKARSGQVMVCENSGATWLPFTEFMPAVRSINGPGAGEAIWTNSSGV